MANSETIDLIHHFIRTLTCHVYKFHYNLATFLLPTLIHQYQLFSRMFDIVTIVGLLIAMVVLAALVPCFPLSVVCPPFCLCTLPLLMTLLTTLAGLMTYWMGGGLSTGMGGYSSLGGTSSSAYPGGLTGGSFGR